ncbi:MAG: GNAT family N-acetyltransferase [Phycisphaerales bacterium]|nr:GNAT family N-acetyltransferase [Phycisphaerales bacterium]
MTTRQIPLAITHASDRGDLESVRNLLLEYAHSLGFSLCFQGFDDELATLPGRYEAPKGRLLLAKIDGWPTGCVAIREIASGIAEMKRLYVPPHYRGFGIGRALATSAIDIAMAIGYKSLWLDTTAQMIEARALYASLGFAPIRPYNQAPLGDIVYMERALA